MRRTRIEIATVPPEPLAPHFDDEATIVSARQVVPLAQAKVVERSRNLLWVIAILLGAAIFGALGALGVNYYENRQRSSLVSSQPQIRQPINQPSPAQTQAEAPLSSKPELPAGGVAASESSSPGSQIQSHDSTTGLDRATVDSKAPDNMALPTKPATQPNPESSPEPSKLTRKRRVHSPTQMNDGKAENPGKDKRGAGRIQEIFTGRDPQ